MLFTAREDIGNGPIRTEIKKILPSNKVLYGGSCNEENIEELNKIQEIDGYLLGGISLKIKNLKELLLKCN